MKKDRSVKAIGILKQHEASRGVAGWLVRHDGLALELQNDKED